MCNIIFFDEALDSGVLGGAEAWGDNFARRARIVNWVAVHDCSQLALVLRQCSGQPSRREEVNRRECEQDGRHATLPRAKTTTFRSLPDSRAHGLKLSFGVIRVAASNEGQHRFGGCNVAVRKFEAGERDLLLVGVAH